MLLERKTREAERLTAKLVDESERRAAEADRLKDELLRARVAEKQAKEKLLQFLSRASVANPATLTAHTPPPPHPESQIRPQLVGHLSLGNYRVAVISAKNHKRQRRKRQSVTAKREKSQTPKVLTAILTLPNLT